MSLKYTFIGGGNMANAILGGLSRHGVEATSITVIDPSPDICDRLSQLGILAGHQPDQSIVESDVIVWAVKPQHFAQAAASVAKWSPPSLHLSVAAGIRVQAMSQWLISTRIVRCMPNTPALIGRGVSALFASPGVVETDRTLCQNIMNGVGQSLWVKDESDLDAVTALSGSGPAYVFYFMEALCLAGVEMGLSREIAQQLVVGTFSGASSLAGEPNASLQTLRQQVTSKGGTTHAAISSMENEDVRALLINAVYAARDRARALGDEFGASTIS